VGSIICLISHFHKSIVIINFSSSKVNNCIYYMIRNERTHDISTTMSSLYQHRRSSYGKINEWRFISTFLAYINFININNYTTGKFFFLQLIDQWPKFFPWYIEYVKISCPEKIKFIILFIHFFFAQKTYFSHCNWFLFNWDSFKTTTVSTELNQNCMNIKTL